MLTGYKKKILIKFAFSYPKKKLDGRLDPNPFYRREPAKVKKKTRKAHTKRMRQENLGTNSSA